VLPHDAQTKAEVGGNPPERVRATTSREATVYRIALSTRADLAVWAHSILGNRLNKPGSSSAKSMNCDDFRPVVLWWCR
jgi:hypothetical protein